MNAKKLGIMGGTILAVGGIGVAVTHFMGANVLGNGPESVAESQPAGPVFVELERFSIAAIRSEGVLTQVGLSIILEAADEAARAEINEQMPYLRDAFITQLHRLMARPTREGEAFDARLAKRRLLEACEHVLGPGRVVDVLIQDVFERPLR